MSERSGDVLAESGIGLALIAGGLLLVVRRRNEHYRRLALHRDGIVAGRPASVLLAPPADQAIAARAAAGGAAASTSPSGPVVVSEILSTPAFAELTREIEGLVRPERTFIPTHKQGGTIAYETLIAHAPACVALYNSAAMRDAVSRMFGVDVLPTPLHDQSSLSVLIYEKPGDHIGWHYDHNFYRGRHFTVLLAIHNQGRAEHGLSHARLIARSDGGDVPISTPPNTMIAFEGARVLHKVEPILAGERRIVLSMTYCADPRAHWWQGAMRRAKDTAFFGIRALWT